MVKDSSVWNLDRKKYRIGNVCLFTENKDYSYRYAWMTSSWLEGSGVWLLWKKLMQNVDIDEPTSFLDHVFLGCIQRECQPNGTIESRISAGATENIYEGE